jgi:hypothetical protein
MEHNKPNREGFAGEGTGPEPTTSLTEDEIEEAERIAIPSGDITGALTGAIEEVTEPHEHGNQDDNGKRR